MENYKICNCKGVYLVDVEEAMDKMDTFSDVLTTFKKVQDVTHCSTGCGGCYEKVLDAISEIMHR